MLEAIDTICMWLLIWGILSALYGLLQTLVFWGFIWLIAKCIMRWGG